ncbi:MAG TPA: hypothetical protein VGH80_06170 [Xanthomonadaceae bacterium]
MKAISEKDAGSQRQEWIAPGAGLISSLVIAMLGPSHRSWYGDALPAFSQHFLALYPLWIFVCAAALAVRALAGTLDAQSGARLQWKLVDAVLGVGSMLVIAAGIIALAVPVFTRASAM